MAQEQPPWLTEEFLTEALQEGNNDPVTVTKISVTPAVAAGNNYMSRLYRVKAKYKVRDQQQCDTFIVKALINKGIITEMKNFDLLANKEPKVYKELLPFAKEKYGYDFGPKSFYCPLKYGLVLGDLHEEGYVMCDRFKQLDYQHCELVFKTLAKFHAASVALYHEKPELIKEMGKETIYVAEEYETVKQWVEGSVTVVLGIIAQHESCKEISEFIIKRKDLILDSAIDIFRPQENKLNVLNHGDLWTNNMLFKHDISGTPLDVKLIDFQISRFTTPAVDIFYFLWSSANDDVQKNRSSDLIAKYLQALNESLEEVGCSERLSQEELQKDLEASIDIAIITICSSLPFIVCETENVINIEELKSNDPNDEDSKNKFMKLYQGKQFNNILPRTLNNFHAWATQFNI